MLAIEEYERTQERLVELTEKLTTLESERTELLLRIENFRTLRYQSFREAFDAIDVNFQSIFAELSDGDGHLQLDNPEDPFQGGLNSSGPPQRQARPAFSLYVWGREIPDGSELYLCPAALSTVSLLCL